MSVFADEMRAELLRRGFEFEAHGEAPEAFERGGCETFSWASKREGRETFATCDWVFISFDDSRVAVTKINGDDEVTFSQLLTVSEVDLEDVLRVIDRLTR